MGENYKDIFHGWQVLQKKSIDPPAASLCEFTSKDLFKKEISLLKSPKNLYGVIVFNNIFSIENEKYIEKERKTTIVYVGNEKFRAEECFNFLVEEAEIKKSNLLHKIFGKN